MKTKVRRLLVSCLAAVGLSLMVSACKERTPAEKAGDAVKEGAEKVADAAKDAGKEIKKEAEKLDK